MIGAAEACILTLRSGDIEVLAIYVKLQDVVEVEKLYRLIRLLMNVMLIFPCTGFDCLYCLKVGGSVTVTLDRMWSVHGG